MIFPVLVASASCVAGYYLSGGSFFGALPYLLGTYVAWWARAEVNRRLYDPPGPMPLPIPLLGNILYFLKDAKVDGVDLAKTSDRLITEYGPIVSVKLGFGKLIFLDPRHFPGIYKSPRIMPPGQEKQTEDLVSPRGMGVLVNHDLPSWRKNRKIMKRHIAGTNVFKFAVDSTGIVYRDWKSQFGKDLRKRDVDMLELLGPLFLNTAVKIAAGITVSTEIAHTFAEHTANWDASVGFVALLPRSLWSLPGIRGVRDAHQKNNAAFHKDLERLLPEKAIPGSLLHELQLETHGLSAEEARYIVLEAIVGGTDSVTMLVTHALYFLVRNPEAMSAIRKEHDSLAAEFENDGDLTYEHVKRMQFTHQVIQETLRMIPPTATFPIWPEDGRDTWEIGGYRLGTDCTFVFGNPGLPTKDPAYWKEPFSFDPGRFSPSRVKARGDDKKYYFPFGLGPKTCPGFQLGIVDGKAMLFKLLQDFDVEIPQEFDLMERLSHSRAFTRAAGGVPCTLSPRVKA